MLVATCVVVLIIASVGAWDHHEHGVGDPGGRILAQLRMTSQAVPHGVTILRAYYAEPKPDSLDGIAGTQCLDDVTVQINFEWSHSPSALLKFANSRLVALGWTAHPWNEEFGYPNARWTNPRKRWYVSLENNLSFGWQLTAQAPAARGGLKPCG